MANWFQRTFLANRPAGSRLANLETSFNPKLSIRKLKNYHASATDICHYGFLGSIMFFSFVVNPAPWIFKILFYSLLLLLFVIPATGQFFFNALPIFAWLSLYFTSSSFDASYRPPITVKVLPAIETILYGDNLSDILATSTNKPLDIVAWLPYGIFHFGAPFVVAAILFICGPPTILRGYAFAFGYMNLFGVMTQNLFPAAPPWYKILNGLSPANYSMHGSPGGLGRIDEYFGINLYTKGFTNSAVIFGAFPSLHSGCATMEALFFSYVFPKLTPLFVFYVCWLWWSTMYLTHHYFVDLMAGSVLSYVIFQYTKYFHLPLTEKGVYSRWTYAEIPKFNIWQTDPLYGARSDVENVPLSVLETDFELNSMENSNNSNSNSPSIFDESSPRSVSRSSLTSTDNLEQDLPLRTSTAKPNKQRFD
ncbi:inositol phosphorylceramide synthase [Kluyveromyces lactis]|uniref:KLLA0B13387p n=1 Tax=Kluyveromyces lactis (strain ATCC 8585 / CBS 2359 / DSM 70799 / NBRC 1267 / NRRL Y-1140 / WM37) TaxID=284590 RepID=Q6CVB2_KLULA|nr:uncharacterized protein KLLA0_B13387g [Kluyveromyces lactis]CAH02520.1 KLLA0B13387p [Kluyveromyces lactis]|eukprot:XP_452127.1 uncharacterized protein KLLA0_B13387g [Kluyveromyces lactis]